MKRQKDHKVKIQIYWHKKLATTKVSPLSGSSGCAAKTKKQNTVIMTFKVGYKLLLKYYKINSIQK